MSITTSVRRLGLALAIVLMAARWAVPAERSAEYLAAIQSITAPHLAEAVEYLADDALTGREAGTRGGYKAAEYLAGRYAKMGLHGGAGNGGYYQPFAPNYRNVVALWPGRDEQLAKQAIIVGAHYDHVGYGTSHSSRGPIGQIHNGADDNASGSAALLELAEALTFLPQHPRRSIVFIGFDAEEKGLLGSRHWTAHPTWQADRLTAMINLDMIGRLRDERLTVQGSRSGYGWRRLVSEQNDLAALRLTFDWRLTDDADHYPFFRMAVPVLTLHTGLHDEYHTPRDKPALLNADGMQRVTRLVFGLMHELAEAETTPMFRPLAGRETEEARRAVENRMPMVGERLGVGWAEEASAAEGVRLAQVNPRSAAARAGLRAGDDIVEFAGRPIGNGEELREAVRGAPNPAKAVVQRGEQREEIVVTLDGSPMRWGIMWRVDDAERSTVALTYVAPGSPAAEAGLERGDRIYQVDGHDFGDDATFAGRMAAADDMVTLSVEREGRLRVVSVSASAARRRAA